MSETRDPLDVKMPAMQAWLLRYKCEPSGWFMPGGVTLTKTDERNYDALAKKGLLEKSENGLVRLTDLGKAVRDILKERRP